MTDLRRQLTEYVPVEGMVSAYHDAEREIREAYRLLEVAQERVQTAFADKYLYTNARQGRYHDVGPKAADDVMAELHRRALRAILTKLKIWPLLSEKRTKELQAQLESGKDLPPIETAALYAMVEGIAGSLDTYLAESISEVFEWLRPRRSEYKTNTEFEVGRKVVLSGVVDCGAWKDNHGACRGARGEWDVSTYQQRHVTALDDVMHYLDGQPKPEGTYYGPLCEAIKACGVGARGETMYFRFKCFHNRNLHLEFKRMDLVKQFNAIAGGRRLREGVAA